MNDIEHKLFDYIRDSFDIGDDPEYTPDVHLFDSGFVDSLGAFVIINFIENTWEIKIDQRDLTLYPMNTVQEIAAVVARKL